MSNTVRIGLLATFVVVLIGLGVWFVGSGDASEPDAPSDAAGVEVSGEAAPELLVQGVTLGASEVSASVTNTSAQPLDRAVVRFDLYGGGEVVGSATASTFGLGAGATRVLSAEVEGPASVDSVAVRETVATLAL